jgi:hypothetical protein
MPAGGHVPRKGDGSGGDVGDARANHADRIFGATDAVLLDEAGLQRHGDDALVVVERPGTLGTVERSDHLLPLGIFECRQVEFDKVLGVARVGFDVVRTVRAARRDRRTGLVRDTDLVDDDTAARVTQCKTLLVG